MACIANVGCVNVPSCFAACCRSIVAIDTGAWGVISVINSCGCPGADCVASVAFGCCLNVCIAFAGSDSTIVTGRTNTDDFIVVHVGRCNRLPGRRAGGMASVTVIAGIDVRVALSGCDSAIVTGRTNTDDFIVIDVGWCNGLPGCRTHGMAGVTIV